MICKKCVNFKDGKCQLVVKNNQMTICETIYKNLIRK